MIKTIFDKIADRTRWGYLVAFIILLISYIVSFVSTQNLMKQAKLVNHSNQVIHSLDNVISYVTRCESASRGYLVTNRPELLAKYHSSRKKADSTYKNLKYLTADNNLQQKNLDTLKVLMDSKFLWIENIFSIFDSSHAITTTLLTSRYVEIGKMNDIENFAHKIQDEEKIIWQKRNGEVANYSDRIKSFNIVSLIVAILLSFYSIITFNKENKAKQEANLQATGYREQLEMRVNELASVNLELLELRNIEKFAATGRISRTIAHEVRNPLTNINLAAEQLRNEIPENDDVKMLFEMISRNSNRINQLISDLLNATRVSELNYVKASVNDVIDSSLEFAIDRIELKHITVIKLYDKNICPILVDEEKIKIAFLNIIVNAIEAMEVGGILEITTERKSDRCIITFTDNGKGMPKEDAERLFEPYFTTKEKGTGLGLTNTQSIILAHNANINVDSEIGKGTTFMLYFNFADED